MISFASQRALGQDLATHLLNQHDNEEMILVDVRGAVADDLHGAFAEWEAQAHALTRCENYLYSLSINPDPKQGPLTREQYADYIARVETKLGLTDQPRAVVFHTKYGREHCHVVWSRIDTDNEKAIHLAFDREKLMMVAREFARDHGLELPDGYFKDRDEKNRQLSLYEMHQLRSTGLSKEDHMERVTDAWRASDNPRAFVQALAESGYMLATGNRPYVLVDFYGGMHALPKLIDDKSVRTKDVRAFLEKDFPSESLPSVEEARDLAAKHRKSIEGHLQYEQRADELAELKRNQASRRKEVEGQHTAQRQKRHSDRLDLGRKQRAERDALRTAHLAETRRIREQRERGKPTGLSAFLGRVTGVELLRKGLHKYQDRKRTKAFMEARKDLKNSQGKERLALARRQEMQALDMRRKLRALEQVEKRELRSLEESMQREIRIQERGGREQMPSFVLVAPQDKKRTRQQANTIPERFGAAASGQSKEIEFFKDFDRASGADETGEGNQGSSEGPKLEAHSNKIRRYGRKRPRDKDKDRER